MATPDIKTYKEIFPGDHFIVVNRGMRGFFACEMWINNTEKDLGPFPEPWQSDPATFASREAAEPYAMHLAAEMDLPFVR